MLVKEKTPCHQRAPSSTSVLAPPLLSQSLPVHSLYKEPGHTNSLQSLWRSLGTVSQFLDNTSIDCIWICVPPLSFFWSLCMSLDGLIFHALWIVEYTVNTISAKGFSMNLLGVVCYRRLCFITWIHYCYMYKDLSVVKFVYPMIPKVLASYYISL